MACGIYGIHNLVNDKWYVGQAQNISARWDQELKQLRRGHFHGHNRIYHIDRAWKKYGENSFEWVVLEECPAELLNEREIYWIANKDSFMHGYNQTEGGGGARGWKMSDRQRKRLSIAHTGIKLTNETRQKLREAHRGKSLTSTHRLHISAGTRGKLKPTLCKRVRCIETGKIYRSIADASKESGLNRACISRCCSGNLKTTGGYHWESIE